MELNKYRKKETYNLKLSILEEEKKEKSIENEIEIKNKNVSMTKFLN